MFCSTASGRSNLEEMIGTWMTVLNAVFLCWFMNRCAMKYV